MVKIMKKIIFCIIFIFSSFCFSQENMEESANENSPKENGATSLTETNGKQTLKKAPQEKTFAELPQGYRKIMLGMDMESTKAALKEDSVFGYRGERYLSILAGKNRSLIETEGSSNIKRSWFQFYEEKLYIIIIQMDTDKISYYDVYSALCNKYGEPDTLDPKRSIWKNDKTAMILERPLALKYIDLPVFNELLEKSKTDKAYTDILREEFINEL